MLARLPTALKAQGTNLGPELLGNFGVSKVTRCQILSVGAPASCTEGSGNKFGPRTLRKFFGVSKVRMCQIRSVSAPAYRTEGPGNKFRPRTLRNYLEFPR
jgi:hypothetical protein